MKGMLSVVLAAGLLLNPFATFAADYGSQTSQTQQVPPVAQTLVREGDFAIKLAAKLDLGLPTDEAVAEDMLAKAGVVPLNGWISDYPVTPEVLGQLQQAVARAASEGKLPMTAEQGTKGLYSLAAELNLPTPAGREGAAKEGSQAPAERSGAAAANPTVINNYYYDEGPPIITYYPPPVYFAYLYDWVPYPVWWFGFWFPGFFICHSFTTTVVVTRTAFVTRTGIVTNHIIDPVTRRVAVVEPVVRTSTGTVRPVTTLRTENGRTFTSLAEMRREAGTGRFTAGTPESSSSTTLRPKGFRSPEAQKSAAAIYSRSAERMNTRTVRRGAMTRGTERPVATPNSPGRSYNGPVRGGERQYVAPNAAGRSYTPPVRREGNESVRPYAPNTPGRSYNAPWRGAERPYIVPGGSGRPYSGPVVRGGHGPMRPFSGNGWRQGR